MSSGTNQERLQQNNQELENIKAIIDTIPDTYDATATSPDIIGDKTAYAKGRKIIGSITPTYEKNAPELSTVSYLDSISLNDFDMRYNAGVKNTTSVLTLYVLYDASSGVPPTVVDTYTSSGYYLFANTAKISHTEYFIGEKKYLNVYVAFKSSSSNNKCGVVCIPFCLTDGRFNTSLVYYNYVNGASWNNSGITTHNPQLVITPKTPDRCFMSYYNISSADKWTHFAMFHFYRANNNTIGAGANAVLGWVGTNSSSTARGFNTTTMQFSEDNKTFVGHTSMDSYGGTITGNLIMHSDTNWSTFTTVLQVPVWANSTDVYKLINNDLVVKGKTLYKISDLNTAVGTTPFTVNSYSQLITFGNTLFYLSNNSDTQFKTYIINNYTLTLNSTVTNNLANRYFYQYTNKFAYTNSAYAIISYIVGEDGNLKSLNRLGEEFYKTTDSNVSAANVLAGKVAYGPNGKIIGTMPNNGVLNYTPTTSQQIIPVGYTSGGTITAVTSSIDNNIQPENIKKDVKVLGVTGTYFGVMSQEEYDLALDTANDILGSQNYTELEYLSMDGTQFIDPLIKISDNTIRVDTNITGVGATSSDFQFIFSSFNNNQFGIGDFAGAVSLGQFAIFAGAGVVTENMPTYANDIEYDIQAAFAKDMYYVIVNNTDYSGTHTSYYYNDAPVRLFVGFSPSQQAGQDPTVYYFKGKCKFLKIYVDNVLLRDLIPVKTSNNVVCFFDKVSKSYFVNAGTGVFTAGPVKEE